MLGHCFGVYPTPGGTALFCFSFAALRVTVSICDGPSANAELGLGSRTHSLGFARCDPSKIGNSKTETKIMYLNHATLMGFLGGDAEVRTGKNDQKFTTFSLATKTSYKNKETGKYV